MGSSPRTRGTRRCADGDGPDAGLIPADAGNTPSKHRGRCHTRAHPRGRGEHCLHFCEACCCRGSSPRTRGTPRCHRESRCRPGLIPADAGNTVPVHPLLSGPRAHPRGRGEHPSSSVTLTPRWGSSPRTRGTRRGKRGRNPAPGLIPADAGNTDSSCCPGQAFGAHPRGRGEHGRCQDLHPVTLGSSPRTRGTHTHHPRPLQDQRLIPADAGNTWATDPVRQMRRAHPRGRGEHADLEVSDPETLGSSPRTRGTPRGWWSLVLLQWAHPRGRGEHGLPCLQVADGNGSSPRTRGTQTWKALQDGPLRLIPADAGNTQLV